MAHLVRLRATLALPPRSPELGPKRKSDCPGIRSHGDQHQPVAYLSAVSKDFSTSSSRRSTGPDADPVTIDFVFRSDHLTVYPSPAINAWIQRADGSDYARGHRPTAGECTDLLAALVLLPRTCPRAGTPGRIRRCDRKDEWREASARFRRRFVQLLRAALDPRPDRHDGLRLPVSRPGLSPPWDGRSSRHDRHPRPAAVTESRRPSERPDVGSVPVGDEDPVGADVGSGV